MSNIYLVIALLATFFAVLLVLMSVDVIVGERNRAIRHLEAQVSSTGLGTGPANLREEELSKSILERLGKPFLSAGGRIAGRILPFSARDRLAKKVGLAGNPKGWDAERLMAFKVVGAVVGVVAGTAVARFLPFKGGLAPIVSVALLGIAGFILPDAVVDGRVRKRQDAIRKALPDFLDILTISVEAGLSLNAAITRAVQRIPGPLSQEFARFLQEVQLGVSRSEALHHVNGRTEVEELNSFVIAMVQAEAFGIAIANVLRTQSAQLRVKRRQRIEMKAQQTPVKIVFPLILCILPSLFVIIVGPGGIRIFQALLQK